MKSEFNPKNYVRLFRFTNVPLILDFFYLQSKKDNKVLAVNVNNQRTVYFTKDEFEKALNEGVKIYGTKESASEFESNIRKAADSFLEICKELQNKKISKKDFHRFGEAMAKFYWFYDRTDFLYTDLAFKKNLIQKTTPHFGKLKEDMRRVINDILLSENGFIYPTLKSISKELDINYDRLLFYSPKELDLVFDGHKFDDSVCEERKDFSVVHSENGDLILKGNAKEIAKKFSYSKELDSVTGTTASKGKVSGRVVVFPDNITSFAGLRKAMKEMQKGDILIAETTSPEIMPACSKAAAIVTNQGGLMSHAAIVSRELKIPCIIATHNATKIFKTGDLIEVDANKGIVKIIKKKMI